jgi:uncharacterized membrane protein YkvA (DUF1232 family)
MSATSVAEIHARKPFDLKDKSEQNSSNASNQSERRLRTRWHKWLEGGKCVVREAQILCVALRDPRVPLRAKIIAGAAAAYIFSPIQLIPTFIPIIGQLDDLCALWIGAKFLRKLTPHAVIEDCEARVQFGNADLKRLDPLKRSSKAAQPVSRRLEAKP